LASILIFSCQISQCEVLTGIRVDPEGLQRPNFQHTVNKWIGHVLGAWTGGWRRQVLIILFFCAPTLVSGHGWYDADCCSDRDCFPAENVVYYSYDRSYTADVHGRHVRVGPEVKKLPSRDGGYHACLRDRPGMPVKVKCWYEPANT